MFDVLSNAALLVHMASLLYVIAFIIRDQLMLRVLVLVATAMYIGYYYYVPTEPLWDAIVWSAILGVANAWVMVGLVLQRTTFRMSDEEKRLLAVFDTLSPGEFRKLLKITEWNTADDEVELIRENHSVDNLYCVLEGDITIAKQGREFSLEPVAFVGEVAFFNRVNASATVRLNKGARYVSWFSKSLRELQTSEPGIRIALYERLNRDMANKVAAS